MAILILYERLNIRPKPQFNAKVIQRQNSQYYCASEILTCTPARVSTVGAELICMDSPFSDRNRI